MIGMLVQLLVLCLIFGVIYWIITIIPLPDPFRTIALVIMALIFLLILIGMLGVVPGWRVGPVLQGWFPVTARWFA